jgi:hypothetical protein
MGVYFKEPKVMKKKYELFSVLFPLMAFLGLMASAYGIPIVEVYNAKILESDSTHAEELRKDFAAAQIPTADQWATKLHFGKTWNCEEYNYSWDDKKDIPLASSFVLKAGDALLPIQVVGGVMTYHTSDAGVLEGPATAEEGSEGVRFYLRTTNDDRLLIEYAQAKPRFTRQFIDRGNPTHQDFSVTGDILFKACQEEAHQRELKAQKPLNCQRSYYAATYTECSLAKD